MSALPTENLRTALVAAIRAAYHAGAGVPPELEDRTKAYARAQHSAGVSVEKVIIDIKDMLRTETAEYALVYIPRIVGWAVAGYYQGASPAEPS